MTEQTLQNRPQDYEIDIRRWLRPIWLRRWLLTTATVLCLCVFVVGILALESRYTARATIIIDSVRQQVGDVSSVLAEQTRYSVAVESEELILESDELARRVLDELGNSVVEPRPSAMAVTLANVVGFVFGSEAANNVMTVMSPVGPTTAEERIAALRDGLRVDVVPGSAILEVNYQSASPREAARMANAYVQSYLAFRDDLRRQAAQSVYDFLDQRLTDLRSQTEAAERSLGRLSAAEAASGRDVEFLRTRLAELTREVSQAEIDGMLLSDQLRTLETELLTNGPSTAVGFLEEPEVIDLQLQLSRLSQTEAEIVVRNSVFAGELVAAGLALIEQERNRLADGIAAVVTDRLTRQIMELEYRTEIIYSEIDEIQRELLDRVEGQVAIASLEREVDVNRQVLRSFLERYAEIEQIREGRPDAAIISPALPPLEPSEPNLRLLAALAIVVSGAIGVATVYLVDQVDDRIKMVASLEDELGVDILEGLPKLPTASASAPLPFVRENPFGPFAEAARTILATLTVRLSRGRHRPAAATNAGVENPDGPIEGGAPEGLRTNRGEGGIILITSSDPGDGKTTVSTVLAQISADSGRRTVFVDGDLRRPTATQLFGLAGSAGLSNVLAGTAALETVMHRPADTSVFVLPAGTETLDAGMVAHDAWSDVSAKLREQFDLIIVDTPPILAVADAMLYARSADLCICIAKWTNAKRNRIELAIDRLSEVEDLPVSLVLNHVQGRWARGRRYGYGGRYGYGRYGYGYGTQGPAAVADRQG